MSNNATTTPADAAVETDEQAAADLRRAARLIEGIRARLRAEIEIDLAKLFDALGDRGNCSSCGAQIWWIRTKNGSSMPVSGSGVSHFSDCPNASIHRRR